MLFSAVAKVMLTNPVFWNALLPMTCTLLQVAVSRRVQFRNALAPMVVAPPKLEIVFSLVQPWNALVPMPVAEFNVLGRVSVVNPVFWNAFAPMVCTERQLTESRLVQPLNALLSMARTPVPRSMVVRPVQFLNV
jgi:hypothetical protein